MANQLKNTAKPQNNKPKTQPQRINILGIFDIEKYLSKQFVLENLNFLGFLMALIMLYIYATRQIEGKARQINALELEIKEQRGEYLSLKAQLMHSSKQSEIAKKLAPYGIEELTVAPKKIIVNP